MRLCQSLTYLGVAIDVAANELRLPRIKIEEAQASALSLLQRKKATLQEVQACNGLLHFACLAVPLERSFLRRMFHLCIGIRQPYQKVTITRTARLDLEA